MTKDYYAILGVSPDAGYAEIKKAWRDMAKQWHPDRFLSEDEKLAAHERFVGLLEAYSVLVDADKRKAYDARFAASGAAGTSWGYENATTAEDQQEVSEWFRSVMREKPAEFAKTTLMLAIVCPVMVFVWMGTIAMAYIIYQIITGQSPLGAVGSIMVFLLFIPNTLLSVFGGLMMKDLYFRAKRIVMWMALRARVRRLFGHMFKTGKPGRDLRV